MQRFPVTLFDADCVVDANKLSVSNSIYSLNYARVPHAMER